MSRWHVWGDFVHTLPDRIGEARLERRDDAAAKRTADAHGFDYATRLRNGFEPWAASFTGGGDDQALAFAAYPIVRGWKRISDRIRVKAS